MATTTSEAGTVADELRELDRDAVRALHRRSASRHFAVVGRQVLLLTLATAVLVSDGPVWRWLWAPAVLLSGAVLFGFSVLLHEVVHRTVFARPRPWALRCLGLAYGFPCGLSPTQFGRWHLDHHRNLGSDELDPKRHHLSPRRNARWIKLLYFTPALFVIYLRASARETATYRPALRNRIAAERAGILLGHLALLAGIAWFASPAVALRVHLLPLLLGFPIWFAINRVGQHYDAVTGDPIRGTTWIEGSRFWDVLFLWSNYHLEHHLFPGVPYHRLPELQALLRPVYEKAGARPRTYSGLLVDWLVRNRPPHEDWATPPAAAVPTARRGPPAPRSD
jgi:fatty acid desaturase